MAVGGAFPEKKLIAELTAKMLLEVEAVEFNSEKPFIFTSGWASPVSAGQICLGLLGRCFFDAAIRASKFYAGSSCNAAI